MTSLERSDDMRKSTTQFAPNTLRIILRRSKEKAANACYLPGPAGSTISALWS